MSGSSNRMKCIGFFVVVVVAAVTSACQAGAGGGPDNRAAIREDRDQCHCADRARSFIADP